MFVGLNPILSYFYNCKINNLFFAHKTFLGKIQLFF